MLEFFTTPIKKGEGISPIKWPTKIDTAVAWGLWSSLTQLIIETVAGTKHLNICYDISKKTAKNKKMTKNKKGPFEISPPKRGPKNAAISPQAAPKIDA